MFTGIIETLGTITGIESKGTNLEFTITSGFTKELKVDQSVAHNGVCLTVTEISEESYKVTAIEETIKKTNLGELKQGTIVNLERCMQMNGRLDGHIVQGHVDQTAECTAVQEKNGSWIFSFQYDKSKGNVTVEKGSICVNGVSLTVVDSKDSGFSVAIIPYTFENTNFKTIKAGTMVNLEFDIIGKYVARLIQRN